VILTFWACNPGYQAQNVKITGSVGSLVASYVRLVGSGPLCKWGFDSHPLGLRVDGSSVATPTAYAGWCG
jgi:hypothetical protein